MTQEDIKEEGAVAPEETKEETPAGETVETDASSDSSKEEETPSEGDEA